MWLIDDAYTFGAPGGSPKQSNMSIDDFDGVPAMVHQLHERDKDTYVQENEAGL